MATDYEDLKRILAPVVDLDSELSLSMLTTLFNNRVRLSFLCGPSGRLNGIAIKLPEKTEESPVHKTLRTLIAWMAQSANSPIRMSEAKDLLQMLDGVPDSDEG